MNETKKKKLKKKNKSMKNLVWWTERFVLGAYFVRNATIIQWTLGQSALVASLFAKHRHRRVSTVVISAFFFLFNFVRLSLSLSTSSLLLLSLSHFYSMHWIIVGAYATKL